MIKEECEGNIQNTNWFYYTSSSLLLFIFYVRKYLENFHKLVINICVYKFFDKY